VRSAHPVRPIGSCQHTNLTSLRTTRMNPHNLNSLTPPESVSVVPESGRDGPPRRIRESVTGVFRLFRRFSSERETSTQVRQLRVPYRSVRGFPRVFSGSLTGPPRRWDSKTDTIISVAARASYMLLSGCRPLSIDAIRSVAADVLPPS
jgi:hypothetical protein